MDKHLRMVRDPNIFKLLLIIILLNVCKETLCKYPTNQRSELTEEPDEDNLPGWLKLIPSEDRTPFMLFASPVPDDLQEDEARPDVSLLFQEDLIGCDAKSTPQCASSANADSWDRDDATGKTIIKYTISPEIRSTMEETEMQIGCLLFRATTGDDTDGRLIIFKNKPKSPLAADWGSETKSRLEIWLNKDFRKRPGNLLHLVMHALGFHKEHVRRDRNDHINIYWENVLPGRKNEFDVVGTENTVYEDPYDFESVLHPDYKLLSVDGKATITGKRQVKIGLREVLSQYDIAKLKRKFCQTAPIIKTPKKPETGARCADIEPTTVFSTVTVTKTTTKTKKEAPETETVTIVSITKLQPVTKIQEVKADTVTRTVTATQQCPSTSNVNSENDDEDEPTRPTLSKFTNQISPSPRKRCPTGASVAVFNLQTMSRTTIYTNYPYQTLKEFSTKQYNSWIYLFQGSPDVSKDWLRDGREYLPEFGGDPLTVVTTNVNPSTKILNTAYEERIRPDGARYLQNKVETRILYC